MCVMSAGDIEGKTIISRLCVCVGLSPDTRCLLTQPPGYKPPATEAIRAREAEKCISLSLLSTRALPNAVCFTVMETFSQFSLSKAAASVLPSAAAGGRCENTDSDTLF